jgi:DNA (cytosine-5)-methyltransferase 1
MCAAGVGAPHIRQRLYFVGHASGQRQPQRGVQLRQSEFSENGVCGVPKACGRSATYRIIERSDLEQANPEFGNMEHAEGDGRIERRPESGRWSVVGGCEFIPCRDGKARPVEPGTFPLAHGVPARVGRLRGYGNAIVPQVAAEFVRAAMDSGHGC